MRIGLAKSSVLVALAHAFVLTKSEDVLKEEEREFKKDELEEVRTMSITTTKQQQIKGQRVRLCILTKTKTLYFVFCLIVPRSK